MPIHPVQARPEPLCQFFGFHEPIFHGLFLQGCRESQRTEAPYAPNDTTAARRITSAAGVRHDYSTSPDVGQQYTGVPGLHDSVHATVLQRVFALP